MRRRANAAPPRLDILPPEILRMMLLVRLLPLLSLLILAAPTFGQFPATRLYTLFPSGGQVGQSVEVAVTGGDDLEEISALLFSHPGITATPKLNDQKQPVDKTFIVTIAADVEPGLYEVFAKGLWGVSNPRRFAISARPQVNEAEPNNAFDKPQALTLNQVVNGRMDGGTDVDWYAFTAQAGQRIVFDCAAAQIDSRMTPVLEVYDAGGTRRLAQSRSPLGADAPLVFDVPVDGPYLLRLHDVTYRNGNDYFYRLDAHTGPHLVFAWPPVGPAGQTLKVALFGYNLPGSGRVDVPGVLPQPERVEVDIPFPGDPAAFQVTPWGDPVTANSDTFRYSWRAPNGVSNAIPMAVSRSPVVLEQEPNEQAPGQAVSVPCEIAGQFARKGDADVFQFDGKAGEVLYLEVTGERLGSPVDPYFVVDRVVVGADGKETLQRVGAADDDTNVGIANVFDTQSDDAFLKLDVPENAKYRVTVRDRSGLSRASGSFVYTLAIRAEQPDFRLVVVPAPTPPTAVWPVSLRNGDSLGLNVLAFRRDGYNGPIEVGVADLPAGVTASPTVIGEGKTTSLLVLTAAENAGDVWQQIRVLGKARIESPAAARNVARIRTQIVEAEKPIAGLQKPVADATAKRDEAKKVFMQAEEEAKAKPDDAALAQKRDAAKGPLDQAEAALTQAQANLDAANKKVADLRTELAQAEQAVAASAGTVERLARSGIVQFTAAANKAANARLARGLFVSVMPEPAPIQITRNAQPITVYQGSQILVPFHLVRRAGFDEKVTAAVQNLPPNTNIEAPQIAFEKGAAEQLARFFVKDNAVAGQHAVWFTSSTPVSYRRNPARADRLKAAFDAATAAAKMAQEAATAATQAKTTAVTAATQAAEALKKAQAEKAAADAARPAAVQKVEQTKAGLGNIEKALAAQVQAVATAEAAAAEAKKQSDAAPDNADLKTALQTADAAVQTAKEAAVKSEAEKQTAANALAEAETVLKALNEKIQQADAAVAKAATDNTAATQAKTQAEQAEQAALAQAKQAEEVRKGAEKASGDQEKASAAKNVNFVAVTEPILIEVKPAPVKLTLNVPNGGALKRGEKIEVKATVARQNGFAGPVKLTLPLPPGVAGVSAAEVEVPAGQNEGTLTVSAAGDATEGQNPNGVVRAVMEFQGAGASVDAPLTLKVVP